MLKRVSRILQQQLQYKNRLRFSNDDETEAQPEEESEIVEVEENSEDAGEDAVEAEAVQKFSRKKSRKPSRSGPWDNLDLVDSKWEVLARFLNTKYYLDDKDSELLKSEVDSKMEEYEAYLGFDLNNLQKFGINTSVPDNLLAIQYHRSSYRTLPNHLSENTTVSNNLFNSRRVQQMIESNDTASLFRLYRNDLAKENYRIQLKTIHDIFNMYRENPNINPFVLNLVQFAKFDKQKIETHSLKPMSSNIQEIIKRLPEMGDVNKLAFSWAIGKLYSTSKFEFQILLQQLTKVNLDMGQNSEQSQKDLHYIYHAVLGQQHIMKVISFSLDTFRGSYSEFVRFWAVLNQLIKRVAQFKIEEFNDNTCLNNLFKVVEANFPHEISQAILTKIVPQIMYDSKNPLMFQFYRKNAKNWLQNKSIPKLTNSSTAEDKAIHQAIADSQYLTFKYNGWVSKYSCNCTVKLITSRAMSETKLSDILSEKDMIEHLVKGQYNTVLNYFLAQNLPNFNKITQRSVENIMKSADEQEFESEDARALYQILKLKNLFADQGSPISFDEKYFGFYKKSRLRHLQSREDRPHFEVSPQTGKNGGDMKFRSDHPFDKGREPRLKEHQEKIFHKPKKYNMANKESHKEKVQTSVLKPPNGMFSTQKLIYNQLFNKFSTEKDSYQEYRDIVKEVSSKDTQIFTFNNKDMEGFKKQAISKSSQINELNHTQLFEQDNIPVVGTGENLLKYLFLTKSTAKSPELNAQTKKNLKIEFESSMGTIEKDYNQYLDDCQFQFALSPAFYKSILRDLHAKYIRKNFKVVVSHIAAFRQEITDEEIDMICSIVKKNRAGITLIEIFNLFINQKIKISADSIVKLCDTLQKYKIINRDVFFLANKYCKATGRNFQLKMMGSYIKSLLIEEDDKALEEFCQILKNQLRPPNYKVNSHLSAEENIKLQKEYKKKQAQDYNRILFSIIDTVVLNLQNKLPPFLEELFTEFSKSQLKLSPSEKAISLIVYSSQVERFLEILREFKHKPEEITPFTYDCWLIAGRLNSKNLEIYAEQAFGITLYTHNFMLTEEQVEQSVNLMKIMKSPTIFIRFLEYCLRYNPPMNEEFRRSAYQIMNSTNEDFAKNNMSGLLDFIFNNSRQAEREEFRKNQSIEEEKVRILKGLDMKQVPENQIAMQVDDLGGNESVKDSKSLKESEKQRVARLKREKEAGRVKAENLPQRVRNSVKTVHHDQVVVGSINENQTESPFLKSQPNMPSKRKSKSLNNFMEIFGAKEPIAEEEPQKADGKGKKVKAEKGKKK